MDAPLRFGEQTTVRSGSERPEETVSVADVIEQLTGFVRRQFPIFIFFVACSLALGMVYLVTTPPSFTSHAMLLIDSSKVRVLQEQEAPLGGTPIDTAQVETQVELLKSENIGLSVVRDLKLTDDPEFAGSGGGMIGRILGLIPSEAQTETSMIRRALAAFQKKRTVTRVARTYVLDIGFTSLSASRSAAIANAIADAYIVDQLESKYQATRRASRWLQDRIKELRQQASDADRAVLDYKEKNKIVAVGGASASGGPRLLGEQQLEDLNTQLGSARAAAEEAKARLERITDVLQRGAPDASVDATVTDTLHSEVINRLRSNYLDIAAKEAIWSARYGAGHLAAVNLRTQMAELRRSIQNELERIAQGYKSDYEIAKSRVEGVERELQRLVASSQVTNRDRLGLTDLESTAKVYHSIYDNFLQRYMEAIQQQSFPITEARVISAAAAPELKSSPLVFPVIGVALLIGILLASGTAVVREAIDQVFRTTRQVENALHINCLAVLPLLGRAPKRLDAKVSGKAIDQAGKLGGFSPGSKNSAVGRATVSGGAQKNSGGAQKNRETLDSNVSNLVSSISSQATPKGAYPEGGREDRRLRFRQGTFMREVVEEPLSPFAEAFRSIKIAVDLSGPVKDSKVIGIISTLPGEGKSTVASNFAELIAHSGKRVILLDADLRNPTLTRALAPEAKAGLLETLDGQVALTEVVHLDEQTGLTFVPAVIRSRLAHTAEILASAKFERFIDSLRQAYDYVIVDLPPLAPVVDVRATTQAVDSYIYVIEWGKTGRSLVQQQLLAAPAIYDRLLGAVLNKSNLDVMRRYDGYYGHYYDQKYYGRYGYSTSEST